MSPCQIDTIARIVIYFAGGYAVFTLGVAARDVWQFINRLD